MHLSPHSLQQIEDAYIESLDSEALRVGRRGGSRRGRTHRSGVSQWPTPCRRDLVARTRPTALAVGLPVGNRDALLHRRARQGTGRERLGGLCRWADERWLGGLLSISRSVPGSSPCSPVSSIPAVCGVMPLGVIWNAPSRITGLDYPSLLCPNRGS